MCHSESKLRNGKPSARVNVCVCVCVRACAFAHFHRYLMKSDDAHETPNGMDSMLKSKFGIEIDPIYKYLN